MLTIHHYNAVTGEYLWSGPAAPVPDEPGAYIVPENATDVDRPHDPAEGAVLAFRDGAWHEIPDHRGKIAWLADGTAIEVDLPGELPAGMTLEAPAVAVARIEAERIAARRAERDARLLASDWTQLPDALTDKPEVKAAWLVYRQALRDLDMGGADWPAAPSPALTESA